MNAPSPTVAAYAVLDPLVPTMMIGSVSRLQAAQLGELRNGTYDHPAAEIEIDRG